MQPAVEGHIDCKGNFRTHWLGSQLWWTTLIATSTWVHIGCAANREGQPLPLCLGSAEFKHRLTVRAPAGSYDTHGPGGPNERPPRVRGGITSRPLRRRCQSPKLRAQQASCMLRSVGASHCRVQWGSSHTRASRHLLRVCTAASSEALPAGNRSPFGYPHNHHHLAKCETSHRDRHRIVTMAGTAARSNTSNQKSSLSPNRIFQSTIHRQS